MSEEITIKISAKTLNNESSKTENREIDIKINQNATINDLVEKIKLNKEFVDGQKYLSLEFNGKILTNSSDTNLFETLKNLEIGNDSILTAGLLPFGEDSKPADLKYWVNISDKIAIKIKKSGGEPKEISLNKSAKCSELIELIKKDKDIKDMAGDSQYFLLTFRGEIITEPSNTAKSIKNLGIEDQSCITIGFNNESKSEKWVGIQNAENTKIKEIKEEKINLINENPQQPNNEINVTFDLSGKDDVKFKVDPEITFNDLVAKFKTQALKKDENYFKGIDKISFTYDSKFISKSNGDVNLSEITKSDKDNITIKVIGDGLRGLSWNISDINNKNNISNDNQVLISNDENQNSSSSWLRILFFVVGILLLIAALVVFFS